jgi:methylated-DNA-protein-cysteine methyltransferase-like protein
MDKTFREAVWDVVAGIPSGYVAGLPNAARRVSGALGQAPKNKPVPWHRVINAQGKISIPRESRWYQRQKDLLQEEGVVIIKGKIDLQRFGWSGVVDHLLWQPPDDS